MRSLTTRAGRAAAAVFVSIFVAPAFAVTGDQIVATAKKYLGVPYKFGADMSEAPRRFDCSLFTKYVFGKYGIYLHRVSKDQAAQGSYVARTNLRAGDLVFFNSTSRPGIDHVGIYMGGNRMINTYGDPGVCIRTLFGTYWGRKYVTARRMPGVTQAAPAPVSGPRVVQIDASTLNVRSGAGTGFAVKGVAHAGERYVQVATSGAWRKIWFDGTAGWIYDGDYSRIVSGAGAVKIVWSTLNVRTGPGTGYGDVGNVGQGQLYARAATSGGWYKIWYRGTTRWVSGAGSDAVTP